MTSTELSGLRRRVLHALRVDFPVLSRPDAEDIVQQAFVSLFRRRTAIDAEDDGLYRYVRRVAKNAALDLQRTQRKHLNPLRKAPRSSPPPPIPSLSAEICEKNQKIRQIFRELDEFDRLILWSFAVDGRSINSIAAELGLNWHRVADSLDRCRRVIRRRLAD